MFCNQCGKPIKDTYNFCGQCGAKVGVPSVYKISEPGTAEKEEVLQEIERALSSNLQLALVRGQKTDFEIFSILKEI